MKDLKQTVVLMSSQDYVERFIAEYWQTKIRYEKLQNFNEIIEASNYTQGMEHSVVEPIHDCPWALLSRQEEIMREYLHILEVRAIIEGISLGGYENE